MYGSLSSQWPTVFHLRNMDQSSVGRHWRLAATGDPPIVAPRKAMDSTGDIRRKKTVLHSTGDILCITVPWAHSDTQYHCAPLLLPQIVPRKK